MAPAEIHYDAIHCELTIRKHPGHVVLMIIRGSDVGEFGEAPMQALEDTVRPERPVDFFIDAREVRGASIAVSGEWAAWLGSHREGLRSVTMLTGSRFIQVTAEFVRRFASLEGVMRICTDEKAFDAALAEALASSV